MKMSMLIKRITVVAVAAVMMFALYTDVFASEEPVSDPVLEDVESNGTDIDEEDTAPVDTEEVDQAAGEEQILIIDILALLRSMVRHIVGMRLLGKPS